MKLQTSPTNKSITYTITGSKMVRVAWVSTNAQSVTVDNVNGPLELTGYRDITINKTTTFTTSAFNADGKVDTRTIKIIVFYPSFPTGDLTISPNTITQGASSTLSWTTTAADTVSIGNNIGPVAVNGSILVSPASTTVYTLTAKNITGTTLISNTLTVNPTTTTTTTTVAPVAPTITVNNGLNHQFTSSFIPITITSSGSNLSANTNIELNPTLNLIQYINYNLIIDTVVPVAIRKAPTDTTIIPEVYNNNSSAGVTRTTLMFTPTATGTLYYVNTNNTSTYGIINIVANSSNSPTIDYNYPSSDYMFKHLFTSSFTPITITSSGSNLSVDIVPGINPTIPLKLGGNYNLIVNTAFPVAIRKTPISNTNIVEIYNNNVVSGMTNTTLMFTPTAIGTLYYVNVNDTNTYGVINITV